MSYDRITTPQPPPGDGLLTKTDRFAVTATAPPPPRDWGAEVWLPEPFEPRYAYPLLIWLHDAGETEFAAAPWAEATGMQNQIVLSVRGPSARRDGGYDWPADGNRVWQAVSEALSELPPELRYDAERVTLAGRGNGAVAAFEAWRTCGGQAAGACLVSPGYAAPRPLCVPGGRLGGRLWIGGFGAASWKGLGRAAYALGTDVRIEPESTTPDEVGPALNHWTMRSIPTAVLA